jgi:hypothetical protein
MNEIKVKRMLLAALTAFLVWVAAEILLEQVIGRLLFGILIQELWLEATNLRDWGCVNHVVNIFISLLNCTLLIWLYASLRPMYGVGIRTALITSAILVIWVFSLAVNGINLGLFPLQAGLTEAVFEMIEIPIAMIAGAAEYEGWGKKIGRLGNP